MNLRKEAIDIIETVLQNVYKNPRTAEKRIEEKLVALLREAIPQIKEKEEEIENLRAALGYTYSPTTEEYVSFDEHSQALWNAGSRPPDEIEHWADTALMHFEESKKMED